MTRSYLGLVTRQGLESLVPETEHAAPFLLRRACRSAPAAAICCWAVLSEQAALEVRQQLDCGRFGQALMTLNAMAAHLGTLLPPLADDVDALVR